MINRRLQKYTLRIQTNGKSNRCALRAWYRLRSSRSILAIALTPTTLILEMVSRRDGLEPVDGLSDGWPVARIQSLGLLLQRDGRLGLASISTDACSPRVRECFPRTIPLTVGSAVQSDDGLRSEPISRGRVFLITGHPVKLKDRRTAVETGNLLDKVLGVLGGTIAGERRVPDRGVIATSSNDRCARERERGYEH